MPTLPRWRPDAACAALLLCLMTPGFAADTIDFRTQIRPLLSDRCFACHGPDEGKRKAGLRLDQKEGALAELKSGRRAVVPGQPEKSTLVARIESADPDEKMPPEGSHKTLSPEEISLLKRWVAGGAEWQEHWAYVAPERPALPAVKNQSWPRNEIDYFVLDKLEKAGLSPSPEADKPALIRRATLDLTGLPPTIEEIDAFLADHTADAYEKVVDRLLGAASYGERMAQNWLDLARYADTSGYHFDSLRYMWLWRDWVIDAFNRNLPFDQFTIEQLAGDMLPSPTVAQRIASGFHRNVMTNDEGGADADEYLTKYIVDRVNTTGVVWLGTTIGCAECHDHKYDPVSQKEFYQLYAFFHNVPEKGIDGTRTENPLPRLSVPAPEQAADLIELDRAVDEAEKILAQRTAELPPAQKKWEQDLLSRGPVAAPKEGLRAHFAFQDTLSFTDESGTRHNAKAEGGPGFASGVLGRALELSGKNQFVEAGQSFQPDRTNAFSFGGWVYSRGGQGAVLSRMNDAQDYRGFDLLVMDGAFEVHLVAKWPDDAIKVRTRKTFPREKWQHVFAAYNGSGKASGLRIYVNGQEQDLEVQKDSLSGSIIADTPVRIGARSASFYFNGLLDEVRLYARPLSREEILDLGLAAHWPVAAIPAERRTAAEAEALAAFYKETHAADYRTATDALAAARARKTALLRRIPNTMVMQEMEKPRDTHILIRGDFQKKGEKVTAGVPAFLPPLSDGQPANRLGLARWLVSPEHPLTSRVTVNRFWALFFGSGLLKTLNDFGAQSEPPSHPELLDWLAAHFRDGGGWSRAKPWDMKALARLIVTSAAYRQSAAVTPRLLERDPYNRLLTRGPRLRLEAEFIRDHALAVSGLLNPKIGGESVKPYQPDGLWDVTDSKFEQSRGADLYRRGMYVFWKRAVHYPSFATFDAPNREVCTAQRPRTSTPLQSFVLMNDPVYLECARWFAARMIRHGGADPEERLTYGFRTALSRRPTARETEVLLETLAEMQRIYTADEAAAAELLKAGESPLPEDIKKTELAAYMCVANVLLNLNEVISK